jgi:phosphoserine phosphatase
VSKSVLTLIAPFDKEKLSHSLITSVSEALAGQGGKVISTQWLSENEAVDIVFTRMEPAIADGIARAVIGDAAVDVIAQDTDDRQKRFLISDMDSTIITVECIDEIADFAGIKPQVAAITERAMRGEIDFISALTERVGLLKGLPEAVLQQVFDERVTYMRGARELVATMRAQGAYTMLVSGGFDFFTSRVREEIGFHADSSNRFAIVEGTLTGNVIPPILDKNGKLQTLIEVSQQKGFTTSNCLAVGDGANDIPMLMAAGLGVAYHAKPLVQKSARACINHCDLTSLLFAQGYTKDEIVAY